MAPRAFTFVLSLGPTQGFGNIRKLSKGGFEGSGGASRLGSVFEGAVASKAGFFEGPVGDSQARLGLRRLPEAISYLPIRATGLRRLREAPELFQGTSKLLGHVWTGNVRTCLLLWDPGRTRTEYGQIWPNTAIYKHTVTRYPKRSGSLFGKIALTSCRTPLRGNMTLSTSHFVTDMVIAGMQRFQYPRARMNFEFVLSAGTGEWHTLDI